MDDQMAVPYTKDRFGPSIRYNSIFDRRFAPIDLNQWDFSIIFTKFKRLINQLKLNSICKAKIYASIRI